MPSRITSLIPGESDGCPSGSESTPVGYEQINHMNALQIESGDYA